MFTILQKDKTISASEINDNFYHIYGNFIPRGGSSLTATDSVYNLGDSSYRWANTHVNNVIANSNTIIANTWNLITSYVGLTSPSRIEISGLNGDDYKLLYLTIYQRRASSTSFTSTMYINGDSGTNYCYQRIGSTGTTVNASRLTGSAVQLGLYTAGTGAIQNEMYLFCDSGYYKKMLLTRLTYQSTTSLSNDVCGYVYSGTETLTSLVFEGQTSSAATTTCIDIKIWGLK